MTHKNSSFSKQPGYDWKFWQRPLPEFPEGNHDWRFWWKEIHIAFIISLISIAFAVTIAPSSGFPAIYGLGAAIIGPIALYLFKGSNIVVCGCAAGLAPILFGAVTSLGMGDAEVGMSRTLGMIFFAGVFMLIIGYFKWAAWISSLFSHANVRGLLAAIAVMLIAGSMKTFTGVDFESHTPVTIFREAFIDGRVWLYDMTLVAVSVGILGFLFGVQALQRFVPQWLGPLQKVPPQFWALLPLIVIGYAVTIETKHLVQLPANPFADHLWPDFNLVQMARDGVLLSFIGYVALLTFVDTSESTATVQGIDRKDRYGRTSDLNRVAMAMGTANIVGGGFGVAISHIPGGAKSTTSAKLGTHTACMSVMMVAFVILEWIFLRDLINLLPQAGLKMIVAYSVLGLVGPHVWREVWHEGKDQFAVFVTTFAVSIGTGDIFFGLVAGFGLQLIIALGLIAWVSNHQLPRPQHPLNRLLALARVTIKLWWSSRDITIKCCDETGGCDIYFTGVWRGSHSLDKVFNLAQEHGRVRFHLGRETILAEGAMLELLHHFAETHDDAQVVYDRTLISVGGHEKATRFRSAYRGMNDDLAHSA